MVTAKRGIKSKSSRVENARCVGAYFTSSNQGSSHCALLMSQCSGKQTGKIQGIFHRTGAERRVGAHRVRLLSAALRVGMRRSSKTWSIHLLLLPLLLRLLAALPAQNSGTNINHRQGGWPSPPPAAAGAAAAGAGTLLKAHDDERRSLAFWLSAFRLCGLKSLLAVRRCSCPPRVTTTTPTHSFLPLLLLLLFFLVRPPLDSPGGRPTSALLPPTSTTHLADIIISHDGDYIPWGLKQGAGKFYVGWVGGGSYLWMNIIIILIPYNINVALRN